MRPMQAYKLRQRPASTFMPLVHTEKVGQAAEQTPKALCTTYRECFVWLATSGYVAVYDSCLVTGGSAMLARTCGWR